MSKSKRELDKNYMVVVMVVSCNVEMVVIVIVDIKVNSIIVVKGKLVV